MKIGTKAEPNAPLMTIRKMKSGMEGGVVGGNLGAGAELAGDQVSRGPGRGCAR
ncbi:MAG: hypothetical protein U0232_23815 [Thermomicrobiales bacterium]